MLEWNSRLTGCFRRARRSSTCAAPISPLKVCGEIVLAFRPSSLALVLLEQATRAKVDGTVHHASVDADRATFRGFKRFDDPLCSSAFVIADSEYLVHDRDLVGMNAGCTLESPTTSVLHTFPIALGILEVIS